MSPESYALCCLFIIIFFIGGVVLNLAVKKYKPEVFVLSISTSLLAALFFGLDCLNLLSSSACLLVAVLTFFIPGFIYGICKFNFLTTEFFLLYSVSIYFLSFIFIAMCAFVVKEYVIALFFMAVVSPIYIPLLICFMALCFLPAAFLGRVIRNFACNIK